MSDPVLKRMFNLIYPVGSIYMSVNATSPQTLFGGTWEQIKDRFLLSCGSTYSNGSTGGESSHKLTVNELPRTSFKIPHVAYFDNCCADGGEWTQENVRANNGYEGQNMNSTNDIWHKMSMGGNQSHNNMPPYLAVYVWKRTG